MHRLSVVCFGLFLLFASLAKASIVMVITPLYNESDWVVVQISGSGGIVENSGNTGTLTFSSDAFGAPISGLFGDLSFGGLQITDASPSFFDAFSFELQSSLAAGSSYSFDGHYFFAQMIGEGFEYSFIPGTYDIVSSDGIFGPDATGTLYIQTAPIPEPGTWALFSGLIVFAWVLCRRLAIQRI